jgi:hypothetical protein
MLWALHTVETRCGEIGLSVNFDKTEFVFRRRRKLLGSFEFFFELPLHCSMSVRCLVVVLDSRLTWKEHVNTKLKKDHNLVWAFRRGYIATWGLRLKVVCWIYVSIICTSITWASLVWRLGCQTTTAKKRQSRLKKTLHLRIRGQSALLFRVLWRHSFPYLKTPWLYWAVHDWHNFYMQRKNLMVI